MKVCNDCAYFKLLNKVALTGKCNVEPADMIVSLSRPICRHFKDKSNFVENTDDDDILVESRGG